MSSRKTRRESGYLRVIAATVDVAREKLLGRKPHAHIMSVILAPATKDIPQVVPPYMYYIRYKED